jgi:hypothetical protein
MLYHTIWTKIVFIPVDQRLLLCGIGQGQFNRSRRVCVLKVLYRKLLDSAIRLPWTLDGLCLVLWEARSLLLWWRFHVSVHWTASGYFQSPVYEGWHPISGSFYTSARLVYAAGRERYLPAVFGKLHPTRHTPSNAALLQSAITVAFILVGNGFRSLINFSVVAAWSFYFLTVNLSVSPQVRSSFSKNEVV